MAAEAPPPAGTAIGVSVRSWVGQCERTRGCVKERSHRGSCQLGDIAEVEYEVETIVDEQPGPPGGLFLVKWHGWPSEDNTWERLEALAGCPQVLRAWRAKRAAATFEGERGAIPPAKARQSAAAGSRDARARKSEKAVVAAAPAAANEAGEEPKRSARCAAAATLAPRGTTRSASALAGKGAAGDVQSDLDMQSSKRGGVVKGPTAFAFRPSVPSSDAEAKQAKKRPASVAAAAPGLSVATGAAPAEVTKKKRVKSALIEACATAAKEPGQASPPEESGAPRQKGGKTGGFRAAEGLAASAERPKSRRTFVGQCKRTDGCVKERGHRGSCELGDIAEVEYEVETIVDEQPGPPGGLFLVKWRGWPSEDNTWERLETLAGCPQVLRAWRASKAATVAGVREAAPVAKASTRSSSSGVAAAGSTSTRAEAETQQSKTTVDLQPPAALPSTQQPRSSKGEGAAAAGQDSAPNVAGDVAGRASSVVESVGRKRTKARETKSRVPGAAAPSAVATVKPVPQVGSNSSPSQPQSVSADSDSRRRVRSQVGVANESSCLSATPAPVPHPAAPQPAQTALTQSAGAEPASIIPPVLEESATATEPPRRAAGRMPDTAAGVQHTSASTESVLAAESTASARRSAKLPPLTSGEQPASLPPPLGAVEAATSARPGELFGDELAGLLEDEVHLEPSMEGREGGPSAEQESSAPAGFMDAAAASPGVVQSCSQSSRSLAVGPACSSQDSSAATLRAAGSARGLVGASASTEAGSQEQREEQQVPRMSKAQAQAGASSRSMQRLSGTDAQRTAEVAPSVPLAGPAASRETRRALVSDATASRKQPRGFARGASGSGQRKGRAGAHKSSSKERDRRLPTAGGQRWNRKDGRFVVGSDSESVVNSDSDAPVGSSFQDGDAVLHMLRGIESAPIAQFQAAGIGNVDAARRASVDHGDPEAAGSSKSKTATQVDGGVGAVLEIIGDTGIAELAQQRTQTASNPCATLALASSKATFTCSDRSGAVAVPARSAIGPPRLLSLRATDASSKLGRPTSPVHAPLRALGRKSHSNRSKPALDAQTRSSAGQTTRPQSGTTSSNALNTTTQALNEAHVCVRSRPPLQPRSGSAAPRADGRHDPGEPSFAQLEASQSDTARLLGASGSSCRTLERDEAGASAATGHGLRSIVSESDLEYEMVDDDGDAQDDGDSQDHGDAQDNGDAQADSEGREARAFAVAIALESEVSARNGAAPLLAHPLEPSIWQADLPHAQHVLYAALPPRPAEMRGHFLFGWQPEEYSWVLDRSPGSGNTMDAVIYCDYCTASFEEEDNEIVQCDGDGCGAAYHMRCLDPPLARMPRGAWHCPSCSASRKAEREAKRKAARRAREEEEKEELSAYEQERLSNIARNEAFLADLGLQ